MYRAIWLFFQCCLNILHPTSVVFFFFWVKFRRQSSSSHYFIIKRLKIWVAQLWTSLYQAVCTQKSGKIFIIQTIYQTRIYLWLAIAGKRPWFSAPWFVLLVVLPLGIGLRPQSGVLSCVRKCLPTLHLLPDMFYLYISVSSNRYLKVCI